MIIGLARAGSDAAWVAVLWRAVVGMRACWAGALSGPVCGAAMRRDVSEAGAASARCLAGPDDLDDLGRMVVRWLIIRANLGCSFDDRCADGRGRPNHARTTQKHAAGGHDRRGWRRQLGALANPASTVFVAREPRNHATANRTQGRARPCIVSLGTTGHQTGPGGRLDAQNRAGDAGGNGPERCPSAPPRA